MHEWDSIIFIMVLTKYLEGIKWLGIKHSFAYKKKVQKFILSTKLGENQLLLLCTS